MIQNLNNMVTIFLRFSVSYYSSCHIKPLTFFFSCDIMRSNLIFRGLRVVKGSFEDMIKAVIFDFGQVLVHFDSDYILKNAIPNETDRKIAAEILFSREYWDRMDDGTLTEEELCRNAIPRIDEKYRKAAEDAIMNWYERLPEWEGMRDLLADLKKQGIPIFLISNISKGFAAHAGEIPILSYIDNAVFSAAVDCVKPYPEIFDLACRRFGYAKEECVFIDDSEKNIKGASDFGLNTVLFDGDAVSLRKKLSEMLDCAL